jgi:hypothetical protein
MKLYGFVAGVGVLVAGAAGTFAVSKAERGSAVALNAPALHPKASTASKPQDSHDGRWLCNAPDVPRTARLFPAHHSTAVLGDQLSLQLHRGTAEITDKDLAAIAATVSLTLSPEGTPVEFETKVTATAAEGTLSFVPKSELSDGWYRLSVTLPAGFVWPDQSAGLATTDFRVGSDPVVQEVSVCKKKNGRSIVEVEFSEVPDADTTATFDLVDSEGRKLGCEVAAAARRGQNGAQTGSRFAPPDGVAVAAAGKTEPRLTFDCPEAATKKDFKMQKRGGRLASFGRAASLDRVTVARGRFKAEGPSCERLTFDSPQYLVARP